MSLEALELARTLAATAPLSTLLAAEVRPGDDDPERFLRETTSNDFHPAGTCAIGEVVDTDCRVLGMGRPAGGRCLGHADDPAREHESHDGGHRERIATTFGS